MLLIFININISYSYLYQYIVILTNLLFETLAGESLIVGHFFTTTHNHTHTHTHAKSPLFAILFHSLILDCQCVLNNKLQVTTIFQEAEPSCMQIEYANIQIHTHAHSGKSETQAVKYTASYTIYLFMCVCVCVNKVWCKHVNTCMPVCLFVVPPLFVFVVLLLLSATYILSMLILLLHAILIEYLRLSNCTICCQPSTAKQQQFLLFSTAACILWFSMQISLLNASVCVCRCVLS